MLEDGPVLKTWEWTKLPEMGRVILARQLPDHRVAYLDYEGSVSVGRGTVQAVDRGSYRTLARDAHHWMVGLEGQLYRGVLLMTVCDARTQWWSVRFSTATATV